MLAGKNRHWHLTVPGRRQLPFAAERWGSVRIPDGCASKESCRKSRALRSTSALNPQRHALDNLLLQTAHYGPIHFVLSS
jgi:hypothetical protein